MHRIGTRLQLARQALVHVRVDIPFVPVNLSTCWIYGVFDTTPRALVPSALKKPKGNPKQRGRSWHAPVRRLRARSSSRTVAPSAPTLTIARTTLPASFPSRPAEHWPFTDSPAAPRPAPPSLLPAATWFTAASAATIPCSTPPPDRSRSCTPSPSSGPLKKFLLSGAT